MSLSQTGRASGADLRTLRMDEDVQILSLESQAAMLPYALAFFGVGLPIFMWVASYATNAPWAIATLAVFAINWSAFYALVGAVRRNPDIATNIKRRTRLDIMACLLWSVAVAQISVFALGAGPAREPLLGVAVSMAVVLMVFTAPCLPALLIVGATAAAPPLIALYLSPDTRDATALAWAAVALAGALSMVLNRMLVRQFALSCERQKLVVAHERTRAEAERLAKSKSDLLATLSHEIGNGLTGVVHVLAAAAGAGGRAAPSREQLNAALDAARDLTSALDATLDSENADSGRLTVRTAPFDPAKLATDLVLLNRPQAAAKKLELSVHVEPEIADAAMGAAVADAARTRQILAQLISNAVKYTLRGRVEVRLRLVTPNCVRFEVADTGPGLGAEELTQAFTPFARIARTSAGSSGAGLGLPLAAKLANLMGGQVSVESAPGVGSLFYLDLPYDIAARVDADDGDEPAGEAHLKVLMVETDALQAAMLRASLEQLGHQVIVAQRPSRVAELLRLCDVDLAIVGECGADHDRGEVVALLRQTVGSTLPIIAVIEGDATEAAQCLSSGADHILRRPVTVTTLARSLTIFVRGGRPSGRAAA